VDKLNLKTQTTVQLAILQAEEEQNIKNIANILSEVDRMCQDKAGMSFADLLKHQESCVERYYKINRAQAFRRILESA
jgi:hypothetical protein